MQTSNVLLMGCQRVLRIFIGDNRIGHDIMGLTAMLYFRYCIPHMGKVTYTLQDTLRVFQGVASRSTESQKCQSQGLSLSLSFFLFHFLSKPFRCDQTASKIVKMFRVNWAMLCKNLSTFNDLKSSEFSVKFLISKKSSFITVAAISYTLFLFVVSACFLIARLVV